MNNTLSKYLLVYPVHYLRSENIIKYYNVVKRVENCTSSDLQSYQNGMLKKIITKACEYGYYDKNIAKCITSYNDRTSCADLINDVPTLTKEKINNLFHEEHKLGLDLRSTSGSTGRPLKFYKDRLATGFMEAVAYYAYSWHGIKIGAPQARFWGKPLTGRGRSIAKIKDILKNRIRFSAFDLSYEANNNYFNKMVAFRPEYFYGYSSLIAEYCKFLSNNNKNLASIPLNAVIGTGEYTYDSERELIESVTLSNFYNEYGCSEIGLIGFECNKKNMHLMASNVYMEIMKDGKSVIDEEGDVHVTELNTLHKPFIRYNLGDRGVLLSEKCSCGKSTPIFRILAGRKDDYVITPEGTKVYDAIFAYTLKDGIEQFKAVQKQIDSVEINIIINSNYTERLEQKYMADFKATISPSINFIFNKVDSIGREPSGKLRYFRRDF